MCEKASYLCLLLSRYHCCIQFVRNVKENFIGDWEKFYPLFSDSVSGDEIIFKNLNRSSSIIVGFDAPISALSYLNDITPENLFSTIYELTEKERNIIKYISG